MALVAIASDLSGAIYSIDHTGDLFCNQHAAPGAAGPLLQPGLGDRIGSGWGHVQFFAVIPVAGQSIAPGIAPNGELVIGFVSADGTNVVVPTPPPGAMLPLAPTNLRTVFGGSDGMLYMVTNDGDLLRQKLAPQGQLPGPVEIVEKGGWAAALAQFTNGDNVFFEVALNGNLRYQNTASAGGRPSSNAWLPLERAWSRYGGVMAAGNQGIYTIGGEGTLELRRYSVAPNGEVQLASRVGCPVIGSGFHAWNGLAADIEAYGWPMSLLPGSTIDFKAGVRLSTPPVGVPPVVNEPANYTIDVRRLRRMKGGVEGVYDDVKPTPLAGRTFQATRYLLSSEWLATGAAWSDSFSLTIPDVPNTDPNCWRSGIYAARCSDSSGRDFYAPFIVRPTSPQSPFAVIANTNTWNAYNNWGGQGKYTHTYPVPNTLPFQRPHPGLTPDDVVALTPNAKYNGYGLSVYMNSCHLLRAELWVLGWLEDLGPKYAYDVYTDHDLHVGNSGLGDGSAPRYKALILNTHPEYWTREMYDRVKAYLQQGGSIIYLGGNGIYEEVVLSPDGEHMGIFPGLDRSKFPSSTNNQQLRLYCLMRGPGVDRPEAALIGVGFQNCAQGNYSGQPYQLQQDPTANNTNSLLTGVTVGKGGTLGAASVDVSPPTPPSTSATATSAGGNTTSSDSTSVIGTYHADGWEVDQRGNGTPPQAYADEAVLALGNNQSITGEMISYRTDQGGLIFAGASLNFGGSMVTDPNLQRIVQNALDLCLAR
ncbi:MAG: N,N-dimethylformamidase beta subunit family domain-containing protein [Gemmatimonadaceae bacterium]